MKKIEKFRYQTSCKQQVPRHSTVSNIMRLLSRCLLFVLLCCFLLPKPSLADSLTLPQEQPLVTQEIRYQMAEAEQVFLVWGVNGWNAVSKAQQPPGTVLKNRVMYTPMTRSDDIFFTKVKVPPNTTIDYVFQVVQQRSRQLPPGTTIDSVFQIDNRHGNVAEIRDAIGRQRYSYHSVAVQGSVAEVKALVQGEISPNSFNIELQWRNLLLVLGMGVAFGVSTQRISFKRLSSIQSWLGSDPLKLIIFALFNRLLLLFIGYLSYVSYSNQNAEYVALNINNTIKQIEQIFNSFNYGDVKAYISIAQNGYEARPFSTAQQANWAFYPLYPIALKLFSFFLPNLLVSGIVLSNIFFILCVVYLYKLIRLDYSNKIAILTSIVMVIFPGSHFYSRPGPESLFLLLVITSFYYGRKNQWLLAGTLSSLAVLARLQGIFLLLPLLYLYYKQYKNSKKHYLGVSSLLLIPGSLFAFMLHLYFLTGNFFASFAIQKKWDQSLSYPFRPILDYIIKPSLISYYSWDLSILSFAFTLFAVFLTTLMVTSKNIPLEYKIYTVLSMVLIVSRNTSQASLRFILLIFPLYLTISLLIRKQIMAYTLVLFTLVSLQVFYFLSFIYHYNWAAT